MVRLTLILGLASVGSIVWGIFLPGVQGKFGQEFLVLS